MDEGVRVVVVVEEGCIVVLIVVGRCSGIAVSISRPDWAVEGYEGGSTAAMMSVVGTVAA